MATLEAHARKKGSQIFWVLISPVLVLLIANTAARFFWSQFGNWAWLGSSLTYWGTTLLIIWLLGDRQSWSRWFGKSHGSKWWILAAVIVGFVSFPFLFFPHMSALRPVGLVILWFLFAVVNSTCEELYWRGFLLDQTINLPRAFGVIYSSILFTAIHPLMLGVYSQANRFDPAHPTALLPFLGIVMFLSLFYSLLYFKTKSLRLPILSHFLTDLGNLSIFLFMNLVIIPM
jgi:membrane protease YdiL (CAAX protease family)